MKKKTWKGLTNKRQKREIETKGKWRHQHSKLKELSFWISWFRNLLATLPSWLHVKIRPLLIDQFDPPCFYFFFLSFFLFFSSPSFYLSFFFLFILSFFWLRGSTENWDNKWFVKLFICSGRAFSSFLPSSIYYPLRSSDLSIIFWLTMPIRTNVLPNRPTNQPTDSASYRNALSD